MCGASRGIGAAAAYELAALGAEVTLLARSEDALKEVVASLPCPFEANHRWISADSGDIAGLESQIKEHLESFGNFEILVNNSGGPPAGSLESSDVQAFAEAFNNHVLVNHSLMTWLLPGMKAAKFGRVINVISTSVKVPIPNLGVSNTTRGAVASWAKTLANELGPHGITVNNVLPGFIATQRFESLRKNASVRLELSEQDVEEMWKKQIPAGRIGEPQEMGAAIAFLASPAAAYVNGVNLPVDGGRTGCL